MRRLERLLASVSLPALLFATGCASVVNGPRQAITVETNPPGATASWADQRVVTPGKLLIPRALKDAVVRVEKEGYLTRLVPLERKLSAPYYLNLMVLPFGIWAGGNIGSKDDHGWDFSHTLEGAAIGGVASSAALMAGDAATGRAWRLEPSPVVVDLIPLAALAPPGEPASAAPPTAIAGAGPAH